MLIHRGRKKEVIENNEPVLDLDTKEIEFIITTLGDANIKIKQIEFVYTLLIKIQKYYIAKTNNTPKS